MKKVSLFIILIFLLSCKKESSDLKLKTVDKIDLEYITKIPHEIDGCSELISYDSIPLSTKYIFLSNLSDLGIIKLDGKIIYLKKDTIMSKMLSEIKYIDVYNGEGYKVILKTEELDSVDEFFEVKGTLEIEKNDKRLNVKIKGERGC